MEFVDACMAVFAHIAMEAVEFVNLSSDEIDNLQFSGSNLQFVLVSYTPPPAEAECSSSRSTREASLNTSQILRP